MNLTLTGRTVAAQNLASSVARTLADALFGAALVCSGIILALGQRPATERLCFVLIALVVAPASALWTRWTRYEEAHQRWWVALTCTTATVVAVLVARVVPDGHTSAWLFGLLLLGRGIAWLVTRIVAPPARWIDGSQPYVLIAGLLTAGAVSCTTHGSVAIGRLLLALAVACLAGLAAAWLLRQAAWLHLRHRRTRVGIDVIAALLVGLAVFQLTPVNLIRAGNMAYFLGPTNDVLHGQPILVDTFSQYGYGMYDALAGVFSQLPLGYGVFSLLIALGSALLYAAVYLVVRMATGSRLIAVLGAAAAVVVYIYAGTWQYVDYPSTGVLRFGPPWLVVLLALAAARASDPVTARRLRAALLVLVGAAVMWSAEVAVYCLGAAVAMALLECAALDARPSLRVRAAWRRVLALAGTALAALLVFMIATRMLTGDWPRWHPYLSFVSQYTTGGLGLLPIGPWSPGIAVGILYGISAAVTLGLLAVDPASVRERLVPFMAIAGITVMGAIEYTYFLGRAAPSNLIHVCAPAVALVFVWLGLAARSHGRRTPTAALAAGASFIAALIIAGDRPNFGLKFQESALGALIEHPSSAATTFSTLARNPVAVPPTSTDLVAFIHARHPGHRQLVLVAWPPVETETLIRSGRVNAVGNSNPCQEAISASGADRTLAEIRRLRPGALLIVYATTTAPLMPIQQYELTEIHARFHWHPVARQGSFTAYALGHQRSTWHGGGWLDQPPTATQAASGCE